MKIAIHSVFILKENILFLEEWIDYHMTIGFDKFYLYDNSKVSKVTGWDLRHQHIQLGKINKYHINYDNIINMSEEEIQDFIKNICNKYKCIEIIEWSPKDSDGNILYNQREAHNDCLKRLKNDKINWCANIDMDEYIVVNGTIKKFIKNKRKKFSNISMGQILFDSRFNNIGKSIVNINKIPIEQCTRKHSNKLLYKVKDTEELNIHTWKGNGRTCRPRLKELCFNHYKIMIDKDKDNHKIFSNIKKQIKTKIKNKFINQYLEIKYNNPI